jgi:hypothetical protein
LELLAVVVYSRDFKIKQKFIESDGKQKEALSLFHTLASPLIRILFDEL